MIPKQRLFKEHDNGKNMNLLNYISSMKDMLLMETKIEDKFLGREL